MGESNSSVEALLRIGMVWNLKIEQKTRPAQSAHRTRELTRIDKRPCCASRNPSGECLPPTSPPIQRNRTTRYRKWFRSRFADRWLGSGKLPQPVHPTIPKSSVRLATLDDSEDYVEDAGEPIHSALYRDPGARVPGCRRATTCLSKFSVQRTDSHRKPPHSAQRG